MATQPVTPMPRMRTPGSRPPDTVAPHDDPTKPAPPPPLQPVAPTPTTTTAAPDPGMVDVTKMTRDYIEGIPGAVGHTTDVAGTKIRDSYEGVYKANAARASRNGVLGTGVHSAADVGTDDEQLRALAGSATDIAEEGHKTAGQMLTNLAQQEAARAGLQQNQQQIGLQQRAADLAAQRQMQEQLDALDLRYREKQPRGYYEDSDPETVTTPGSGGGGGGSLVVPRGTPIPGPMRTTTGPRIG